MMKTFTLEIRTPEKKLFNGQVTAITVRAVDGELGVLANHVSLATVLDVGRINYLAENGEKGGIDSGGGFLLIDDGAATILCES